MPMIVFEQDDVEDDDDESVCVLPNNQPKQTNNITDISSKVAMSNDSVTVKDFSGI